MLSLKDLYNPNGITAIQLSNGTIIELAERQGFQEYPKSIELWEMYNNRLMRVQRWLSKSILCTYK